MAAATGAEWRQAGSCFEHAGQTVCWRQHGDPRTPSLLLIHGFPTSSGDWRAIWSRLASHYHVIAPDLLGFGRSAKPWPHRYSIGEQADILEALLADLRVDRWHVLAHDYGDTVAQELLARHGAAESAEGLRSVCFLNGGLFPETHRPLVIQRLLMSPLGGLVARLSSRRSLGTSMRRIFGSGSQPDPGLLDEFWEAIRFNNGKRVLAGLIGYMRERVEHRQRWVGAMQTSRLPLRLIDGLADPISGAHMVQRYRELVPNADVCELPGIGHYPQIEAPDRVVDAYLEFRAGRSD